MFLFLYRVTWDCQATVTMLINQLLFEKNKENLETILGGEVTFIVQLWERDVLLPELKIMKM